MTREVYGPFPSIDEAIVLVNGLQLKGTTAKDISIFADHNDVAKLKERTSVKVETDPFEKEDNHSLMDKVKNIFAHDEDLNLDIHDKLVQLGISDSKATVYESEIKAGKILVVADDKMRMGHDPLFDNDYDGELSVRRNI